MPRRNSSGARLSDAVAILDLEWESSQRLTERDAYRVLTPQEEAQFWASEYPQGRAAAPLVIAARDASTQLLLCTRCAGSQRVAGKVKGLTVRCPDCTPAKQLSFIGANDGKQRR